MNESNSLTNVHSFFVFLATKHIKSLSHAPPRVVNMKVRFLFVCLMLVVAIFAYGALDHAYSTIDNTLSGTAAHSEGARQYVSFQVSGNVYKSGSSSGVGGAHLSFNPQVGGSPADTNADGSGHYSISLQQGTYNVKITANNYKERNENIVVNSNMSSQNYYLDSDSGNGGDGGGDGNPFGNMSSLPFDMSMLMGFSMFFCLGTPIELLILCILAICVFVRLGKTNKMLKDLSNQPVQQQAPAAPQYIPPIAPMPPQMIPPPGGPQAPPPGQPGGFQPPK